MTTRAVDESTSAGDMGKKRTWSKPVVRYMDDMTPGAIGGTAHEADMSAW